MRKKKKKKKREKGRIKSDRKVRFVRRKMGTATHPVPGYEMNFDVHVKTPGFF